MSRDGSPNGLVLQAETPVAKMGKWPLYIVLLALLVLGAALIYSVNFAHVEGEEEEGRKDAPIDEKKLWSLDGSGLALKPPKDSQQSGVLTPPPAQKQEPIVIVQRDEKTIERRNAEAEEIRRNRSQAAMSALSAPLSVKRRSNEQTDTRQDDATAMAMANALQRPDMSGLAGQNPDYNPAADKDKEAFFDRARKTSWLLDEQRVDGMPYELKTGAVIPGVMLTGINSDLPGNMIAQVAQNVYDTATGRNLLIPQGTKIYGVYDSRVVYGQSRVLIAWNRLIFPDGSSISLGAMPGGDMSGMAGFNDEVDNQYFRIFGSAFLLSLVTGGMAYALDSANSSLGGQSRNGTSMQDEMTSALAAQLGQTTTTLLQKNLNIKPTLEIRPGYQFNIVVTKDVAFRQPYTAWR